jgi:hypothetical protein
MAAAIEAIMQRGNHDRHWIPGREPLLPEDGASEDQRHAEAFRDLEPHIRDCVEMSKIAAQMMGYARCDDEGLAFAVFHLHEMLLNLQKSTRPDGMVRCPCLLW